MNGGTACRSRDDSTSTSLHCEINLLCSITHRSRSASSPAKRITMAWRLGLARPPTPVVWMVCSCVAEHLRAGHHALPELFRERGQRSLVNTQCTQAIPSERHGHPALFLFDRSTDLRGRLNLLPDRRQPRPSARRISKREEFVSPRQRWHSHQQDVLNVIEFKHDIYSEVAGKVLA